MKTKIILTIVLILLCNAAQADYNWQEENQRQLAESNRYAQQQQMIRAQQQQNYLMQQEFNQQHQQMLNNAGQRGGINPMIPLMGQPPRFCGPYGCY